MPRRAVPNEAQRTAPLGRLGLRHRAQHRRPSLGRLLPLGGKNQKLL